MLLTSFEINMWESQPLNLIDVWGVNGAPMLYACRKGVVDGCTEGSENNGRMRAIIA